MVSTEQSEHLEQFVPETIPDEKIILNCGQEEHPTTTSTSTTETTTGFVDRLSEYSIVNSTLGHISRVYTTGKSSSRIIRLGGDTVEHSMRYVGEAFEPQLKSLDGYAGRQLGRLDECARSIAKWTMTVEIQEKVETTLQGLKNAETYIDFLMNRLRTTAAQVQEEVDSTLETWSESVHAKEEEASKRVQNLRENIHREIVQTLRNVVELVNSHGSVLPLPGQETLKGFLLSLPVRFSEDSSSLGKSSKIVLLANDAVILIKSLSNVLTQYLNWASGGSDDPTFSTKEQ